MALTRLDYTSNGVETVYDVSFDLGYIRKEHVYVYLDDSNHTEQLSYTWVNNTQVQLDAPLPYDTKFSIRRVVPRNSLVNDYTDGAILEEVNLDNSFKQTLMILQEYTDGYLTLDDLLIFKTDIDMDFHRILNLPPPLSPTEPIRVADIQEYLKLVSGYMVVQEEVPVGTQGARWYKPSIDKHFVYYINPDSLAAQWIEEPSAGQPNDIDSGLDPQTQINTLKIALIERTNRVCTVQQIQVEDTLSGLFILNQPIHYILPRLEDIEEGKLLKFMFEDEYKDTFPQIHTSLGDNIKAYNQTDTIINFVALKTLHIYKRDGFWRLILND